MLERGLVALDRKLPGFAHPEAVLCGVEARSSAPVRLVRDESFQALGAGVGRPRLQGVYPAGEGAGYAGGIMSAAVDGLRVAEAIVEEVMHGPKDAAEHMADALDLAGAVARLRAGEPLLFPTDTVVGLGVAVEHAASPAVLARLKHRPEDQPVAWLVGSLDDLDRYGAAVPPYAHELARNGWPGGLTLIVAASDAVPAAFRTAEGTVALRVPACSHIRTLIDAVGSPLATTSANLTGEPAPRSLDQVNDELRFAVPVLPTPTIPGGTASTIIDCTAPVPRTIRP